jgi:hypothetical protein
MISISAGVRKQINVLPLDEGRRPTGAAPAMRPDE